ncbi:hypothetical protein QQM79_03060 [Marinobacteraceae bacterium S3BR75-40.1]
MQSDSSTQPVEAVQAEILDIFMDLKQYEEHSKLKAASKRRLAARRAIEQHYERKQLERAIEDYWLDD